MATEGKTATRTELGNRQVLKILEATLEGGLIEDNLSLRKMAERLGPSMADFRGYFCAWSNVVLVIHIPDEEQDPDWVGPE